MTRYEKAEATLLRYKLNQPVGGSGVSAVDVILVDLVDSDGAKGLGFTYVLGGIGGGIVQASARSQIERYVLGQPVIPPQALWRGIAASFNRTGLGPNAVALAAIDVAAWDLEGNRRGVPLGVAMGGCPRPVPVYGSGGFVANQSPEEALDTALSQVARGVCAVKARVQGVRADLKLMATLRKGLPEHVQTMFDANEKCDVVRGKWLLAAARDHGALFVEEPLRADDMEGYRALVGCGGATVAAGEHLQGGTSFLPFLSEHLVGLIQPDLAMAGGMTPVLEIAALAEAFGVSVAPHFLPGLFVHLAAARPVVAWLEEFPLIEPLFEGWPELGGTGVMEPLEAPGHGLRVPPEVRRRFAV